TMYVKLPTEVPARSDTQIHQPVSQSTTSLRLPAPDTQDGDLRLMTNSSSSRDSAPT
ncbi:Hypothetical predicted protein, partial [Marmota monax]